MSLDVYLLVDEPQYTTPHQGIFIRRGGGIVEITRAEWDAMNPGREPVTALVGGETTEVYSANITHNLRAMAKEAEIYEPLWRPRENGIKRAAQLIEPLTVGLALLRSDPGRFRQFDPANKWGDYNALVAFVDRYLAACQRYPNAAVSVWV